MEDCIYISIPENPTIPYEPTVGLAVDVLLKLPAKWQVVNRLPFQTGPFCSMWSVKITITWVGCNIHNIFFM